jgi:DNA-binding IclR family transcriptional regulator
MDGEDTNGVVSSGRTVKSVDTLFSILEYLKENDGAGVTELSQELGLSKGAVHRYLRTLVENGYAVTEDGTYRLGLRFLDFGAHVRQRNRFNEYIEPKVEQLADQTGERAQYLVEEHGVGIYLFRESGENAVKTDARVGKVVNLHTTAAGKAILAHLPEEKVEEILDRHGLIERTERTISDPDDLRASLADIRERGYALNRDEHVMGLWAAGVAIRDKDNRVLGGLSVSGPTTRMRERIENEEIQQQLLGVANEIELNIRYS